MDVPPQPLPLPGAPAGIPVTGSEVGLASQPGSVDSVVVDHHADKDSDDMESDDGHEDQQANEAGKGKKRRFRFNAKTDIILLKEGIKNNVLTLRYGQRGEQWSRISDLLSKVAGMKVDARKCRERLIMFIKRYTAGDKAFLKKRGTEEECKEREELIQSLVQLNYGKVVPKEPEFKSKDSILENHLPIVENLLVKELAKQAPHAQLHSAIGDFVKAIQVEAASLREERVHQQEHMKRQMELERQSQELRRQEMELMRKEVETMREQVDMQKDLLQLMMSKFVGNGQEGARDGEGEVDLDRAKRGGPLKKRAVPSTSGNAE